MHSVSSETDTLSSVITPVKQNLMHALLAGKFPLERPGRSGLAQAIQ